MTEIHQDEQGNKKGFIYRWIIACAFGYSIGISLGNIAGEKMGFPLGRIITSNFPFIMQWVINSAVAGMVAGTVSSSIASFSQWLVLRKYLLNAVLWIPFSMAGFILSSVFSSSVIALFRFLVGDFGNFYFYLSIGSIILSPFLGLIRGSAEWVFLREQSSQALKWIQVRIVGEIITSLIFSFTTSLSFTHNKGIVRFVIENSVGFISGIIFALISGFVLYSIINSKANTTAVEKNF